jgi:hypothetical protein
MFTLYLGFKHFSLANRNLPAYYLVLRQPDPVGEHQN